MLLFREELNNETVSTDSSLTCATDSVCPALRPAAGQNSQKAHTSGSVKEPKGMIKESEEKIDCSTSNEGQRKRHLTDVDGFVH